MKATEIANGLFENENYQTLKSSENEKKSIEAELKNRMGELKRYVNKEAGVVTKFVANNTYSTNVTELNEFLDSYGILPFTNKIDIKNVSKEVLKQIEQYKNESEYYVKINSKLEKKEYEFTNVSTSELLERWILVSRRYKTFSEGYKEARDLMNQSNEFSNTNKLKFEYGSISRIKKEDTYDIKGIIEEFGSGFVIKNSIPVMTKIDDFINEGYFSGSEIDQFKTLISMGLKFVVMTIDDENKLMNHLNYLRTKASLNLDSIKKQKAE